VARSRSRRSAASRETDGSCQMTSKAEGITEGSLMIQADDETDGARRQSYRVDKLADPVEGTTSLSFCIVTVLLRSGGNN